MPRIFARPVVLRDRQALSARQLVDRLNELGYTQRVRAEQPGEFAIGRDSIVLGPRGGEAAGLLVRVAFARRTRAAIGGGAIDRVEVVGQGARREVRLEEPLITALVGASREKRRNVPLAMMPTRMRQAVLAIEDRRFYEHPGVDPIGMARALVTNIRGDKRYLVGGSTLTQQLVKNFFLTPEKTVRRKLLEQSTAVLLERRLTKDRILELYLNDVYVGHRGSFAIHGVAEAARLFFGKDISNITLAEAATIAGVIQAPHIWSPFRSIERARDRRNVVLRTMVESGFISGDAARRAAREPLAIAPHALEAEAPYFVDYVGQTLENEHPAIMHSAQAVDVHTTLDLHLQRIAQDAVGEGMARVDRLLASRRRRRARAQVALIAVDPRSGEILALVGGRSYNHSQFNRAIHARRQPGSVFKPYVYLAAFERAQEEGWTDLTPATVVLDEPTTFAFEEKPYQPSNYGNQYDGAITLRHALAFSRNVPAVKVAEAAGFERVADLWQRLGAGTPPRPYPSIALGVFEATPIEIATAYTIFPNLGAVGSLHAIERITAGDRELARVDSTATQTIASRQSTYLVTNMMRSVLNEGTGAGARSSGFALEAAGKSGTTNDLRDAWFVGFTPELLTVVWVGFDDNQPLGLSGTQAALPIWTTFMTRALAGHPDQPFDVPEDIAFADIDEATGKLATLGCTHVVREAFVAGTEPIEPCPLHHF
ncbi:MAG: PBP1A family penicillin-binding protein [Acidobacteria bacterium]|nr:PBP1A family penicillin-binding protein [Acidobacteriota bacterium]